MTGRELVQDRVERCLGEHRVKPAQRIVRPEFDNDCIGGVRHRPVEAAKPPGSRVTGHTGVGNFHGRALGFECSGKFGRKSIFHCQSKTGTERVAEHHNVDRPLGCFHRSNLPKHAAQCEHNRDDKTLDRGLAPPI